MNPMEMGMTHQRRRSGALSPVLVACGAFAVGAVVAFGYVQWKAQQRQMALMTQMIEQMRNPPAQEVVTRAAAPDLLSVTTAAAPAVAPAPTVEAEHKVVVIPASAPAPESSQEDLAHSTADRIRALVERSSDPLVSAAIAQDVARRETMSVAIQGVNELVAAAVAGKYTLTSEKGGSSGATRLHISFGGHEEDQHQLEKLLGSAAAAGMIAFSDSVHSSDGSFDGEIILFDLVERALVNGSPAERRTGEEMRNRALALLGQDTQSIAAAPVDATGERFYTVEAGDSLAYIALQFYGNTNDYQRIFKANRDKLSSPEKIQIGQRLRIPTA